MAPANRGRMKVLAGDTMVMLRADHSTATRLDINSYRDTLRRESRPDSSGEDARGASVAGRAVNARFEDRRRDFCAFCSLSQAPAVMASTTDVRHTRARLARAGTCKMRVSDVVATRAVAA